MRRVGPPPGKAKAGIVLAHGRYGRAEDILGLFEQAGLPDVVALAPEAPGNSWWPTSFLAPLAQIRPYVDSAVATMRSGIEALEKEGLTRDKIWLGGFSQGACLALETFAREGEGLAGVFSLSGGLLGTDDAPGGPQPELYGNTPKRLDYSGRRDGSKVWISVFERDPMIPIRRVEDSIDVLRKTGAEVKTLFYPGEGHSATQQDLAAMRRWLNT
ncbi:MAG: phospholipase [Cereibacter sphaeroides]|uniref:Phospholipase n=1 Tax=Cereibacter sphaeroides TaxID=1063 RepID=A0A2W5S6S4_CERSP|nr:MAG: phospholipase [Cereibacter sphaeroides]